MNYKNWLDNKSAATSVRAGLNFCQRFRRRPQESCSALNFASCKMSEPKMLRSDRSSCLRVEKACISGQTRKIGRASGRPLNDKTPVIEQQSAQPGKFFAAARSPRTAVQATRHDVAVPGELSADAGINDHDAAVQIANAEHNTLQKRGIGRKNRSNKRAKTAPRNRDEIFHSVIRDQSRHRAKNFDVVHKFCVETFFAREQRRLHEGRFLRIRID